MVNSPCKGCPDRYVGCHGKCKLYTDFKEKLEIQNAAARKAKEFENGYLRVKKNELDKKEKRKRSS